MRTIAFALIAVLACSALVAQPYPVVDVFLDISDPDTVTLTALNENGIYGGAYFALDGLQVFGAIADLGLVVGPSPWPDPEDLSLRLTRCDGNEFRMWGTRPTWMEYGFNYTLSHRYFESSDPSDYSPFSDGSYSGYFRIIDAGSTSYPNGWNDLGSVSGTLLGQIIPEPATLVMLALGGVSVIRRRR